MADPVLRVKRLCPDSVIPTRIESGSIGYDLHCTEQFDIEPTEIKAVNTGLSVHIPERFYGRISPKSGLALSGIDVLAGVIDNSYRGEIKVLLINHGKSTKRFEKGSRVAQLILERAAKMRVIEVDELDETERGKQGFGEMDK